MCGINGFNFEDKKLIQLMNKTIKHRGPDDDGFEIRKNLSLGHLRLSIQDLSFAGHQPMQYKYLEIVFNGEIYNFKEIKEELIVKGYKFKSKTDTEVILASYLEWGVKAFEKFNGMWALCIYDKKKNELILSKDRFGKKPLYYYLEDGKFIFSSEIKAILKSGIKKNVDRKALNEIFTYRHTFEDRTILKNIYNFKPGHYMKFDLKKNKISEYKKFYNLKIKSKKVSFKFAKKKTFELVEDAVKKRMVSDVPVACFLSGGLDSSIITYFAKQFNPNLNTFSVGFDTTNELSYARIIAKKLNTNHREFIINKDNILDYLEDMVYHMDEPIGADPGFLPIFVLSKNTIKYNRVVLTGDGGDEIFTGYDRYKLFQYGRYLKNFTLFNFKNEIYKRLKSMKDKEVLKSFVEIGKVFNNNELKKLKLKEEFKSMKFNDNLSDLTNAQIYDIKTILQKDLFMKSDKMSSAFGLEQRTPFMDYRLVEFGLSLPIKFKLFGWNEKYILKKSFKDILPKEIWSRRKHGFNVPIDYWFENVLGDKLRNLLENRSHNLYDKSYVYDLLDKLKKSKDGFKGRNIIAQKLWTVLIFEMWYERFM